MRGGEVEGWINKERLDLGVGKIESLFEYIGEEVNGGLMLSRANVEQVRHPVLVGHGIVQALAF